MPAMALRDLHYLELVQRERLAEAAMEREASVAAPDGWLPEEAYVAEPSIGRDIVWSVIGALIRGGFSVWAMTEGGWLRWLGAVLLSAVVLMAVASARRVGRRLVERRG